MPRLRLDSCPVVALISLWSAAVAAADNVTVANNTRYDMLVNIPGVVGGMSLPNHSAIPVHNLQHGSWYECQIESPDSLEFDFLCAVWFQPGGAVALYEKFRDEFSPPPLVLWSEAYMSDGTVLFSDYTAYDTARNVRFLVTGDPQYERCASDSSADCNDRNNMATATLAHMQSQLGVDQRLRGMIIAGDLTQFADTGGWNLYTGAISGYERFWFDGFGNHDQHHDSIPNPLHDALLSRKRNTLKARDGGFHYSWDWHDVHFVQCNLFPGDDISPDQPAQDPLHALSFLREDLAANVGDSCRPVVLIHHYGFDPFSMNQPSCVSPNCSTSSGCDLDHCSSAEWWTENQRIAYWNTIADYNVIAIFTGHLHLHPDPYTNNFEWDFAKPAQATGGPPFIPAFVSGAAEWARYLDVTIDDTGAVIVKDMSSPNDAPLRTVTIAPHHIYVDSHSSGYGAADAPFQSFSDALHARLNDSYRRCAADGTIDIKPENEPYAGSFNITTPVTMEAWGSGVATIGG